MKILPRIISAVAFAALLGGPALADPFRVQGISVDVTQSTANDAVLAGRSQARLAGAQRLIERLTLPEDLANAANRPEAADVARLYKSLDTGADEKRSVTSAGARYIATLAVNFDGKAVREYLDSKGVPFVESQAGKALIVPAASAGVDPGAWAQQWTMLNPQGQTVGKTDETLLTPYVASIDRWNRRPTWADVQADVAASGSVRAVIAEAYNQGGQYYVRLSDLRSGAQETVLATSGPAGDLASAQAQAAVALERAWKTASVVRTTGSTSMAATASFRSIQEWVAIRRGLEQSRLVSGLNIESISATGADLSFVFSGRPDQLAGDLRSRGLDLRGEDNGWVVVAASASQ